MPVHCCKPVGTSERVLMLQKQPERAQLTLGRSTQHQSVQKRFRGEQPLVFEHSYTEVDLVHTISLFGSLSLDQSLGLKSTELILHMQRFMSALVQTETESGESAAARYHQNDDPVCVRDCDSLGLRRSPQGVIASTQACRGIPLPGRGASTISERRAGIQRQHKG